MEYDDDQQQEKKMSKKTLLSLFPLCIFPLLLRNTRRHSAVAQKCSIADSLFIHSSSIFVLDKAYI